MILKRFAVCGGFIVGMALPASAAFVSDEFNGDTLGSHWTWSEGVAAAGDTTTASFEMTGTHFKIQSAMTSEQDWVVDNGPVYRAAGT